MLDSRTYRMSLPREKLRWARLSCPYRCWWRTSDVTNFRRGWWGCTTRSRSRTRAENTHWENPTSTNGMVLAKSVQYRIVDRRVLSSFGRCIGNNPLEWSMQSFDCSSLICSLLNMVWNEIQTEYLILLVYREVFIMFFLAYRRCDDEFQSELEFLHRLFCLFSFCVIETNPMVEGNAHVTHIYVRSSFLFVVRRFAPIFLIFFHLSSLPHSSGVSHQPHSVHFPIDRTNGLETSHHKSTLTTGAIQPVNKGC